MHTPDCLHSLDCSCAASKQMEILRPTAHLHLVPDLPDSNRVPAQLAMQPPENWASSQKPIPTVKLTVYVILMRLAVL